MAGITMNIPTPASITPRAMRTTPPSQSLAHLPLLQNTMGMGMNMGMGMGMGGVSPRPLCSGGTTPDNRFVGGGSSAAGGLNTGTLPPGNNNGTSPPYIYPGFLPNGTQRRLWHTENAVWQFDRNYPYNQSYSSQYGFPMMPMGFEQAYGGQRFVYPGYYNQSTSPGVSRGSRHPSPNSLSTSPTTVNNNQQQHQQQQQQQQQQSPQQHSENDREVPQTETVPEQSNQTGSCNGHHVPSWRPHTFDRTATTGSRDRYGMGGRQLSGPGHTVSKSFYNSGLLNDANGSGHRFKQSFDQRSGQQRNGQQNTGSSNGISNTGDQAQTLNTNSRSSSSHQANSNSANNNNNNKNNINNNNNNNNNGNNNNSNNNNNNSNNNTNNSNNNKNNNSNYINSNNNNNNNNNNGNMNNNNNSKVNNSYQPSVFKPRGRERQSIKRGKYNIQCKETNSNSSGSLSTSSSKSQLERRVDGVSSNTSLSPHKHRQRSYRNRFRYGGTSEVERKVQSPTYQPPIGNNPVRRLPSTNFQQSPSIDYGKQQSRQQSRYYQSRHMEGYGYQPVGPHHHHHHYMMYTFQGHVDMGTDGNGNPLMGSNATPEGEQPLDMDFHSYHLAMDVQNGVYHPNAYKQDMSEMDNCLLSQDGSLCGGLEFDDGQSYGSFVVSSDSCDSESELSDTSVESLVRHITVDCLAKAMSAELPDLNGPNLVPYGDMHNLKELERKSQMGPSNGYKCINTPRALNCCGDMLNVVNPVELAKDQKAQSSVSEDADDDSSEASALSCSPSACSSKSTMGSAAAAAKANIIMDESPDSDLPIIMHNRYWREFFGYTPADRFLLRAKLIEMKRPPRTVPSRSKWDRLSLGIWKKFVDAQQTCQLYKTKMRLWRSIYSVTMDTYPRYGLYLVGSSISYFGSKCSDMDICMLACTNPNIDPRMEAVYHLQLMRELLSNTQMFQDFNLIEARVPILRFTDRRHKVELDINFNNSVGIRNTHLLYCYSQLEWRVRPIALTVKQWAQHHNINNAKNMTISSYSLMLMVIHYLQAGVNPPVLPCLHKLYPEKFGLLQPNDFGYVDMNEIIGPYQSDNHQPLGELLLGFLHYYSVFEYNKYVISIRVGGVLPVDICRSSKAAKNDIHQWNELCIEEPFDQTNTARSVYDPVTFDRIRAIFFASYRRLEATRNLNSIFELYDGPTISMQPTVDSEHDLDGHYVKLSSRTGSTSELFLPSPKQSFQMFEKSSTLVWRDFKKETTEDEQKSSLLLEENTTSESIEKSVSPTNSVPTTTNTPTIVTTTTTTTTTTVDTDTTDTTNIIDTTENTITTDNISSTTSTTTAKNQLADDHVAAEPPLA
ncbi:poly(A) RNA polymerase gld-2 homolog A [Drosophila tropicalis]|uniref:poly(A) RNA polymerase gld-2 homolog A n=1 Tax=Drosophila tropicalis TaxID=46794 RepID=UPI0035AB95C1